MSNFFNKTPYTDFHELNLDWLLERVNNIKDHVKGMQDDIIYLQEHTPDMDDYYDKTETDTLLADKADVSDLPDMTDYYDKTETDALLADKADVSSLAAVATSGAYADLSGQPTIPAAANNGQLTIQKNGTTIDTFTADSAVNKTVNIKVGEIQYIDIQDTPTSNGNIRLSLNPSNQCVVTAFILNPPMDCCLKPACWRTGTTLYWGLNCTYNVYPYQPITDPIDVRVFYFNY